MRISRRELILLLLTLAAALFGATAILARPKFDAWKDIRRRQREVREAIEADRRLIGQRERWANDFDELKAYLPQYPMDKKMDIHWLSIMDTAAARHGVRIMKRQVEAEERVGDIYELPIEVRDWEGSLAAIVGFLFDLQSQGAMLDIRHLYMKPDKQKILSGRFTLYCAYTRESPAGDVPAAP